MALPVNGDGAPEPKRQCLSEDSPQVWLLDYGAGNVQSLCNAIQKLGCNLRYVEKPEDIVNADRLLFPGVGAIGVCIERLHAEGYFEPLRRYLQDDRPFFGICLGMQTLFESSEESPGVSGLGVLPGKVTRFPKDAGLAVPSIGWNGVLPTQADPWPLPSETCRCYFVHSFRVPLPTEPEQSSWVLARSEYAGQFVSAVRRGNCVATQFHPEKSGTVGLKLLEQWLAGSNATRRPPTTTLPASPSAQPIARRVIACLDVRSNDNGDLVVTKGDQYDVKESGVVRNLGKPVALAERYYEEGADEVTFLNITAFRETVLADQPMLEVLRSAAAKVFVPLTVGGGIRGYTDGSGRSYTALEVADAYFRAGADKVSIGTDAVEAARAFHASGGACDGTTSIELISKKYGAQAVVISIDPRRVYVSSPDATPHACVELVSSPHGPEGERYAWYCCTVKGGREDSEIDVVQLAQAVEALGAGEVLLNCIDRDGQGTGYELELIRQVKAACTLPVIASSGAGCPEHFSVALRSPDNGGGGADAVLAAGIFHRREVPIDAVKRHLEEQKIPTRC